MQVFQECLFLSLVLPKPFLPHCRAEFFSLSYQEKLHSFRGFAEHLLKIRQRYIRSDDKRHTQTLLPYSQINKTIKTICNFLTWLTSPCLNYGYALHLLYFRQSVKDYVHQCKTFEFLYIYLGWLSILQIRVVLSAEN